MNYWTRVYNSDADKALMWEHWQAGESFREIAGLFSRHHSSVRGIFERCGDMRMPTRRCSARSLTLGVREAIFRGIAAGRSLRCIALRLGRAPSKVYFCDSQSPWERGSTEEINGLLRQYFPKGMDLSNAHQNHVNAIARRLNEQPRKTLGYYSPGEKFAERVAAIT